MQIKWYDWITPTTPFASVFIGALFIVFIALIVWLDTKNFKTTGLTLIVGMGILFLSVIVLNRFGFYI